MSATLVSAHCPACKVSSPVVAPLPHHTDIAAWELECGHAYLKDSQHNVAAVSVDQWQAALYWASTLHLIDLNGNRTPSFQRLCAQFSSTRTNRYATDRYVTIN